MLKNFSWLNKPTYTEIDEQHILIRTEADTDLWEKTHYGFSRRNAHMLVTDWSTEEGEFQVSTSFNTSFLYDQCGIVIYLDEDNWAKFSSEYETSDYQRLGGVVTKDGYSDWSTQNISSQIKNISYKIKRVKNDFQVFAMINNEEANQLRIFNLKGDAPLTNLKVGVYACSPQNSSFDATFTNLFLNQQKIL